MPGLGDLFSSAGGIAEQLGLWSIIQEIVGAALEPYMRALGYLSNAHDPNAVASPEDLAQLVVRGVKTEDEAQPTAAKSGVGPSVFSDLLHIAAGPPGLESILQWYRRGIVQWGEAGPTKATVANAIATSRLYTYWSDVIRKANVLPIPAAEMVDAMVEGQTSRGTRDAIAAAAAGGTAPEGVANSTTFYEVMWANGYTPDQADLMFNTRGNPPAPTQLITLFRRGAIEWTGVGPTETTVQQGIYEGATKDKWEPLFRSLVQAIPSEYYILNMLKTGQVSKTDAIKWLNMDGYTPLVVKGIVGVGAKSQTVTYAKLTESLILKVYKDKIMSRTTAKKALMDLGYSTHSATFVLESQDMTLAIKQVTSAIAKIRTLFVARKISSQAASSALAALGVNGQAATQALQTWVLEREVTLKLLTAAEVVDAWYYQVITQTEAMNELIGIGYTPYDAWVLLSVKNKQPLPNPPSRTSTTVSSNVT